MTYRPNETFCCGTLRFGQTVEYWINSIPYKWPNFFFIMLRRSRLWYCVLSSQGTPGRRSRPVQVVSWLDTVVCCCCLMLFDVWFVLFDFVWFVCCLMFIVYLLPFSNLRLYYRYLQSLFASHFLTTAFATASLFWFVITQPTHPIIITPDDKILSLAEKFFVLLFLINISLSTSSRDFKFCSLGAYQPPAMPV